VYDVMSLSPCFPAVVMMVMSAPLLPKQFTANHPFVFVIQNVELGVVLFAGRFSQV
jgi:serine protease inhibitor